MPVHFDSVFVSSTGLFMPGEPVGNDDLDRYIAPLNAASARIKRRILAENGIKSRHYAIAEDGTTLHLRHSDGGRGSQQLPPTRRRSELRRSDRPVHRLLGRRSRDARLREHGPGRAARPPDAHEQSSGRVRGWHRSSAACGEHTGAERCRPCAGRRPASCRRACSSARVSRRAATKRTSTRTSCAGCCPTAPAPACSASSRAARACH